MKKLVPPTRSSNSRTPAANNTAKESSIRTAVINQAQQVSGRRIRERPRARRSSVVAMKFKEPKSDPTQKMAMETIQSV